MKRGGKIREHNKVRRDQQLNHRAHKGGAKKDSAVGQPKEEGVPNKLRKGSKIKGKTHNINLSEVDS